MYHAQARRFVKPDIVFAMTIVNQVATSCAVLFYFLCTEIECFYKMYKGI